jgi:hypothetical protein
MYPFGRKSDEPNLAWSLDEDRKANANAAPKRSFFSLWGKKKKDDDDDDDDLPGPNATATLAPLFAFLGDMATRPIATA